MNYIHETVLRDIMDTVSALKDNDAIQGYLNIRKNNMRSINQAASNYILTFPVLCSKNVSIKNANMITKAIERKATTLIRLVLAAQQVQNLNNADDILRKYHINLDADKVTVDQMLSFMDEYVMAESSNKIKNSDTITIFEEQVMYKNDIKNINMVLDESVSTKAIHEYKIINDEMLYGKKTIIENTGAHTNPVIKVRRAPDIVDIPNKVESEKEKGEKYNERIRASKQQVYEGAYIPDYDDASVNSDVQKSMMSREKSLKDQLIDDDVKKANELISTTMAVSFILYDEKTGATMPVTFLIGIKAKLYPVNGLDITTRLVAKNKDGNVLNKFIRATTREISFVRDFLFSIDKAKIDALSQSRRGSSSRLWNVLERRANKSNIKRNIGLPNDAMAISTLCVTQEEVELIKKDYNVNLEDVSVISRILEGFNLLCFCIIDDSNEVCKFIFDETKPMYETIAFNGLEREAKDNDYKTAVTLMSKIVK